MEVQRIKEGDSESIKNYIVDYLIRSGFVVALTKKTLFPSYIDYYLDDFISEVWISILEQKPTVWIKLYNTAKEKGTDIEYQARNYFSKVIRNVVRSDSSNAYRRLVKHNATELQRNQCQWDVMSNSIADSTEITDTIQSLNDEERIN